MRIPNRKTCYRLIREMAMPDHIVGHSLQVCRVALTLVQELAKRGKRLNRQLVEAGALLHDITKSRSFTTGEKHTESGHDLLVELGYQEVGDIVRQHVKMDDYTLNSKLAEANIVNYADKRVLHDRIVTLDQRMDYILTRYGTTAEYRARLHWLWDVSREQEKMIFSGLPVAPLQIEAHMDRFDITSEIRKIKSPTASRP